MDKTYIVSCAEDVTPDWLTKVLSTSVDKHGLRVQSFTANRIGNGLLADSVRFDLVYADESNHGPSSVVGKFPSKDPVSRTTAADFCLYKNELLFYKEISQTVRIKTPKAYLAEFDAEENSFTLLMEDLSPARMGNQLLGCSIDDCMLMMREAAALHGPRWGDPTLLSKDWLQHRDMLGQRVASALPSFGKSFIEGYGELLTESHVGVVERFIPLYGHMLADRSTPRTVQHSDFRLDNMLFDVTGEQGRPATLDWQTVSLGSGLVDVAFFIGGSLPLDTRREYEEVLVRHYHEALMHQGVKDYGWDQCWCDYRRFTFLGLCQAVVSTASVERTERGDELFVKMASDHAQHILDHNSLAFWS